MSGHGAMHAVGFFVSMVSLVSAAFVLARRFGALQQRGWAAYSVASGVVTPVLVMASMAMVPRGGIALAGVLLVTGAWIVAVSAQLRRESMPE